MSTSGTQMTVRHEGRGDDYRSVLNAMLREREGRSLGIGLQDWVPNHRKLRGAKVLVVSVPEKAGREPVRYEPRRRT